LVFFLGHHHYNKTKFYLSYVTRAIFPFDCCCYLAGPCFGFWHSSSDSLSEHFNFKIFILHSHLIIMDNNSFMELELTLRYLQEVNRHRDSILRMNILRQDENGLARIIVYEADIPCPPPRPKPRIFQCPGVKQVAWIQTLSIAAS
jgi:hypothetical protein